MTTKKIAAISDNGVTISQHFGRASLYVVLTIEDGKVVSRETRAKLGHQHFAGQEGHQEAPDGRHGYDADAQDKHARMAGNIGDCAVLLAGGMGWGAYDSLKGYGIEAIVTDIDTVDRAVQAYLDGSIQNLFGRLH